jgi:hypothetical protein
MPWTGEMFLGITEKSSEGQACRLEMAYHLQVEHHLTSFDLSLQASYSHFIFHQAISE